MPGTRIELAPELDNFKRYTDELNEELYNETWTCHKIN